MSGALHLQAGADAPAARARLGVILPSVNTVVEPWFSRVVPADVSLHAARMFLSNDLSAAGIVEMDRTDGSRAIRQIAGCRPHAIAYCCTASSVLQGRAYDEHLRQEITDATGVPATTATDSILEAFRLLGISRVTAVSPYTEEVDAAEHRFFAAACVEIVSHGRLDIADGFGLAAPGRETIKSLARRVWDPRADGLLITCLNMRAHEVADELEAELGKPVVTSTQATLWRLMRLAGIDDRIGEFGRLLREH